MAQRYPTYKGKVSNRSVCFHCSTVLRWYEMIPILSALILRFKCTTCKKSFSAGSFTCEVLFLVGALFFTYISQDDVLLLLTMGLMAVLVYLSVVDWRIFLIPDRAIIFLFAIACFLLFKNPSSAYWIDSLSGAVFGFLIPFLVRCFFKKIRGYEGLGFGDVKLISAAGMILGIQWLGLLIVLSGVIGILFSLISKYFLKLENGSVIPFGPSISFVLMCLYVFNLSL